MVGNQLIFALPTYLFAGSLVVMILVGVIREMTSRPPHVMPGAGTVGLRPPEGRNARQILAAQGTIAAFLIARISWLAHLTHAMPTAAPR